MKRQQVNIQSLRVHFQVACHFRNCSHLLELNGFFFFFFFFFEKMELNDFSMFDYMIDFRILITFLLVFLNIVRATNVTVIALSETSSCEVRTVFRIFQGHISPHERATCLPLRASSPQEA